jgi:hypothetical protein
MCHQDSCTKSIASVKRTCIAAADKPSAKGFVDKAKKIVDSLQGMVKQIDDMLWGDIKKIKLDLCTSQMFVT